MVQALWPLLLQPKRAMATLLQQEKPAAVLPQSAKAIALLLASTPSVVDAPPRVLHMLLEFAYRYTAQVLSDAQVFAEHAGRPGKITTDDVALAIQGKVGFEFGGRVPKEVSCNKADDIRPNIDVDFDHFLL